MSRAPARVVTWPDAYSIDLSIGLGTSSVVSVDLGLGDLSNVNVVAGLNTIDATLTRVVAVGQNDGKVKVTGNANATAAVKASVLIAKDSR